MKCKILLALALLLSGGILDTEYLRAKIEKLKLFDDEHIILAVAKAVEKKLPVMSQEVILYKSALKLNDVLAALAREAKHNLMQPSLNNPPSMEH